MAEHVPTRDEVDEMVDGVAYDAQNDMLKAFGLFLNKNSVSLLPNSSTVNPLAHFYSLANDHLLRDNNDHPVHVKKTMLSMEFTTPEPYGSALRASFVKWFNDSPWHPSRAAAAEPAVTLGSVAAQLKQVLAATTAVATTTDDIRVDVNNFRNAFDRRQEPAPTAASSTQDC